MAENTLMLTKAEIQKAVDEAEHVKVEYPSFWKFYEMIMDLNKELMMTKMEAEIREDPE